MSVSTQSPSSPTLDLRFGFDFQDLYQRDGLVRLDSKFLDYLKESDSTLLERLRSARSNPASLSAKQSSDLIIAIAPHLEDFIGELFDICPEMEALQAEHNALAPLLNAKRKFVQKRALTGAKKDEAKKLDGPELERELE